MPRILVVDDDTDLLKAAERILSSAGFTVMVAEDALRAIEWLDQLRFDLLLSDANMPHYSGFELINTVRNNPKHKDLNIAMLTGLRERADVERALKVGVDDYIVKPLDPLLLVQKVNALFQKRPPPNYPEIRLASNQGAAVLKRAMEIESISELGLRLLSSSPLYPGEVLDLQAEVFQVLDIEPPTLKILSVEKDVITGRYRAQVIFLGAREAVLQKIRRWLYSHGASNRAV